jgi:hypothetical protein
VPVLYLSEFNICSCVLFISCAQLCCVFLFGSSAQFLSRRFWAPVFLLDIFPRISLPLLKPCLGEHFSVCTAEWVTGTYSHLSRIVPSTGPAALSVFPSLLSSLARVRSPQQCRGDWPPAEVWTEFTLLVFIRWPLLFVTRLASVRLSCSIFPATHTQEHASSTARLWVCFIDFAADQIFPCAWFFCLIPVLHGGLSQLWFFFLAQCSTIVHILRWCPVR